MSVVVNLDKYIIARALMTGSDLSERHWARIDAAIERDPEYREYVRECRTYRRLQRARARK